MDSRKAMALVTFMCIVLLCLLPRQDIVDAQVTFSRDWTPGKRNSIGNGVKCSIRPAVDFCQMLLNEIRILAACEAHAFSSHQDESIEASRR